MYISDVPGSVQDNDLTRLLENTSMRDNLREYAAQMQRYNAGIQEIKTKLEILDAEFSTRYEYNPIHHIESRLKTTSSILNKLQRRNLPISLNSIRSNLYDVAGVRVICNYIDDVYRVADLLTCQNDIHLISSRDYIKEPKENGYRSLHLVLEVPVYLAKGPINVVVEVQLRTIAMDFWASLEHKLRYKNEFEVSEELRRRLQICAEAIAEVDVEMQDIHQVLQNGDDEHNHSGIA
ncbi:MAG: GTP pyrophosphokinase family protein [Clostridia bacterium]|nr:GTP pyrophosphokinase family protein [Clostridia bacterium]